MSPRARCGAWCSPAWLPAAGAVVLLGTSWLGLPESRVLLWRGAWHVTPDVRAGALLALEPEEFALSRVVRVRMLRGGRLRLEVQAVEAWGVELQVAVAPLGQAATWFGRAQGEAPPGRGAHATWCSPPLPAGAYDVHVTVVTRSITRQEGWVRLRIMESVEPPRTWAWAMAAILTGLALWEWRGQRRRLGGTRSRRSGSGGKHADGQRS